MTTDPIRSPDGRDPPGGGGLLFVSTSLRYPGPVAVWILVAGWAAAVRARYGDAWIVTPEGLVTPEEALDLASRRRDPAQARPRRLRIPLVAGTARRDVAAALQARRFRTAATRVARSDLPVRFVWQYHSLFQNVGFTAARTHGVPLVLFVDAPVVWEGERWGVRRPGWGRLLERVAEVPQLRAAELVACVSEEVADAVRERGVSSDRIVVAPCGVDTSRFHPGIRGSAVRERHGIGDRFVVGWVGSFRRFHGLDLLLRAFAEMERQRPDAVLMLVGDGLDRPRVQRLAAELRIRNAIFAGNVPYADVPEYVAAFDAGVVLDAGTGAFHYSPLKLREYMAAGRAVVGPRVGEIERTLVHGREALLVEPGSADALLAGLIELHDDAGLRRRLGSAARSWVNERATWAAALERTEAALAAIHKVG